MLYRFIAIFIACAFFAGMPLSAEENKPQEAVKKSLAQLPVFNVKNLTEEMVLAFVSGEVKNIILEIPEGLQLPLKFSLTGNLVNIQPPERDPVCFCIQQTTYIAIVDEGPLFSVDLDVWYSPSDFFSGNIDFTLDSTPEGPALSLSLEINHDEE